MSYDDNNRNDPDRGAYTPPDDDDLPFRRGGFDARGPEPRKPIPMMLIISVVVLLVLLAAIGLIYGLGGVRSPGDAPPVVGESLGDLTGPAPVDAQPVDPEGDITAYDAAPQGETPQFAPPPEEVQPRPEPEAEAAPLPPARVPETTRPAAAADAAPPRTETVPDRAATAPTPTTGGSAVQIGAFSSRDVADREYAAVAAAFPEYARGRTKGVEQVTSSSGSTLYRTTFNGFSREQATAFCAALRNAGRDCLVR
ncbi:MAG: SPOR domain-containing protein [Brevundimonas sp.]|uniref:SPOR domain-containing protein n=1 Tax=Brevundimonas sp. TaxID=1871086 RepID=UPI00391D68B1